MFALIVGQDEQAGRLVFAPFFVPRRLGSGAEHPQVLEAAGQLVRSFGVRRRIVEQPLILALG